MSKIAFVFPGQGAQFVGMGKDIYENNETASQLMITVRQEDRNKAVILLNNEKLTVHPTVSKADKDGFIRLCYLLPRKLKVGSCEILFKPDGTEWTSAVYEVRLLK